MAGFLTAIEVPSWDAQGHIRLPEKSRRDFCIKNTWTQLMTLIVSHLSPKAFTILSCLDQLELSGSILHKLTFLLYANLTKSVNEAFQAKPLLHCER